MMPSDMTGSPRVSVIIPLYNHEPYIEAALNSVLEQSFDNFEVVVIDDGSTDNSAQVVLQIKDPRIQYHFQENRGAHNAINRGIQMARGQFVAILNSDDMFEPERLETLTGILEADDTLFAAFSHISLIDAEGRFQKNHPGPAANWTGREDTPSFKDSGNMVLELLAGNFLLTTSNLFCRKSVFDGLGFFRNLKYAHDYDFFLRLCHAFPVKLLPTPLLKYRIHDANTARQEKNAEIDFEVGLVLASFFLEHDIGRHLPPGDIDTVLASLCNSLETCHADRMLAILMLMAKDGRIPKDYLWRNAVSPNSRFHQACLNDLTETIKRWNDAQEAWSRLAETQKTLTSRERELSQSWLNSQEAWGKWAKVNDMVTEMENKLAEAVEESYQNWLNAQEAWDKNKQTNILLVETEQKLSNVSQEAYQNWLNAQNAWQKWEETNSRLITADETLTKLHDDVLVKERALMHCRDTIARQTQELADWQRMPSARFEKRCRRFARRLINRIKGLSGHSPENN